jgi:hypothetical protein
MTAFWMTWKPTGWPLEQLRDLVGRFDRDGTADEPWRIIAHKRVHVGDRVFAFKQGMDPRGIFGVGTIVGAPFQARELSPDPKKPQHFVWVRFTRLVDPTRDLLIPLERIVDFVPQSMIRAQASGYPLQPGVAVSLADLLGLPSTEETKNEVRNPDWNRDELILALDAYVRWNGNPPSKTSVEIEALSKVMNDLRHVLGTQRTPTLRNANGVYMKLMNLRRFDPAFASRGSVGLKRGNRLEEEIWNEFHRDPSYLGRVAASIRERLHELLSSGAGSRPT